MATPGISAPSEVTTPAAAPKPALLAYYEKEIERYERATSDWRQDAKTITDLYLEQEGSSSSTSRKFPLLWANVETLKPAVYAKLPIGECSRRYKDKDRTGRIAAEVLERVGNTTFDLYNVDEVLRMVRDDRLIAGRGTAWIRYEPTFTKPEPKSDEDAETEEGDDDAEEDAPKLAYERICVDYIHWSDFGHSMARVWADVRCVWRNAYLDRDKAVDRFGDKAKRLSYNSKSSDDKEGGSDKARITEIWDKKRGKVVWIAKEYPDILEEDDPPLKLRDFFPCPEPCYATKTSKSLIPTPDYTYYRTQAKEINDLTARIQSLTKWLKMQGFTPAAPSSEGPDAVKRLVAKIIDPDATIVEVESWAGFSDKGGAGKIIDWLPVQYVAAALQQAILVRAQLIQDVFQITGISDILRGQTDPNETLGAQQLKAQTGSRRLKNTRDEIVRFARDLFRLVCEVAAEQFQPETLEAMSGFKYQPATGGLAALPSSSPMTAPGGPPTPLPGVPNGGPPPMMGNVQPMNMPMGGNVQPMNTANADMVPPEQMGTFDDAVIQLLRDDRMRGFRIDIETDSSIQADEDAEKQRRVEFLTAMGTFMDNAVKVLTVMPQAAPMIGEFALFATRGFRAGRMMEDTIERTMAQITQQIQQKANQPPPPDPKVIEAQSKAKITEEQAAQQQKIEADKHAQQLVFDKQAADQKLVQQDELHQQALRHADANHAEQMRKQKEVATHEMKTKAQGLVADGAAREAKMNGSQPSGAAVKLNLGENVGKSVADAVAEALRPVASELGKAVAGALTNVTLKQAPRVRIPQYDKAGNIIKVHEQDEPTGTVQ